MPYGPEKYLNELLQNGFKKENITIFDHQNANYYKNINIDIIYVTGGNTFIGLKLIKDCGFDREILNYINNNVTYIGRSARAHLLTKNVEHVLEFDTNDIGLSNYEAFGILDGILICHYNNMRKVVYKKLLKNNKYNVYTLTNHEILYIKDNNINKI